MLIHLEREWAESRLTVEGQQLHRKAHQEQSAWRGGVFIARGLLLASCELGLFGRGDVVEFRPPHAPAAEADIPAGDMPVNKSPVFLRGAALEGWTIVPIEYKRGRPKANDCDRVQVCAQAMCLEEMLQTTLLVGEIFYGLRRRRVEVALSAELRRTTREAARRLTTLFASEVTPSAQREPKCDACSLVGICLPDAIGRGSRTGQFVSAAFRSHLAADGPASDRFGETAPRVGDTEARFGGLESS